MLLLNYADLKADLRGELEWIAVCLEIDVTRHPGKPSDIDNESDETLLDIVVRKASFSYMKAREQASPGVYGARFGRPNEPLQLITKQHINKGVSGKSEEFFTPSMKEKFEKGYEENLRAYPELRKWIVEGGPWTVRQVGSTPNELDIIKQA